MWCTYLARSSHSDSIIFVSLDIIYGIWQRIFNSKFLSCNTFEIYLEMEKKISPQFNFRRFPSILSPSSFRHNPFPNFAKAPSFWQSGQLSKSSHLLIWHLFLEKKEQNKMYCCSGVKQRCKLGKYTFHEVLIKDNNNITWNAWEKQCIS